MPKRSDDGVEVNVFQETPSVPPSPFRARRVGALVGVDRVGDRCQRRGMLHDAAEEVRPDRPKAIEVGKHYGIHPTFEQFGQVLQAIRFIVTLSLTIGPHINDVASRPRLFKRNPCRFEYAEIEIVSPGCLQHYLLGFEQLADCR